MSANHLFSFVSVIPLFLSFSENTHTHSFIWQSDQLTFKKSCNHLFFPTLIFHYGLTLLIKPISFPKKIILLQ